MEQGQQQLLDTILAEAQDRAQAIRQEAQDKTQEALRCARDEMGAYLAQNARKDDADGEDLVVKATTAATMEGKKALLAAKRGVLADLYRRLLDALYALPHDAYLALVDTLLQRYAQEGDTVLMAKNCAINYGEVQSLAVVRRLSLTVQYGADVTGGIKLVGASLDKDLTFEALCHSVQADTEMDLAMQLFAN